MKPGIIAFKLLHILYDLKVQVRPVIAIFFWGSQMRKGLTAEIFCPRSKQIRRLCDKDHVINGNLQNGVLKQYIDRNSIVCVVFKTMNGTVTGAKIAVPAGTRHLIPDGYCALVRIIIIKIKASVINTTLFR